MKQSQKVRGHKWLLSIHGHRSIYFMMLSDIGYIQDRFGRVFISYQDIYSL